MAGGVLRVLPFFLSFACAKFIFKGSSSRDMQDNGSVLINDKDPPNIAHSKYSSAELTQTGESSSGSAQTYSLVNIYPNITEDIILIGFSINACFVNQFTAVGISSNPLLTNPFDFATLPAYRFRTCPCMRSSSWTMLTLLIFNLSHLLELAKRIHYLLGR